MPMHVISQKALREFWALHPEAESALRRWHQTVESATWNNFAEIRGTFASADACGRCVVFNVGGNKYRIIAAVHFNRHKVYLRSVLTHAEYDRGAWKADCGEA
jgi:mRNA interferase HigB